MHQTLHRIPSLDGLRAISVLLVVFSHLLWTPDFLAVRAVYTQWFAPLGELGVRVFFVISGFLITSLLLRELERHNRIELAQFYFRRTLRIFLPYYFFVLSILVVEAIGWIQLPPRDLFHALTYTVNYNAARSMYLGHAWSLSVEEQFYLLWPAVLLIAGRRRGLFIAVSVMALCPVIRLVFWYLFPSLVRYEIGYRFETVADSIAAGCILAGTYEWLKLQPLYHRVLQSKLFILIPMIIYGACLLRPGSRSGLLFGSSIQNVGIACCIVWAIENYASRIGTLLNSKPLSFIGLMSYSIYLWQQPFLIASSAAVTSRFPLNLLLIAFASLASYYCIERPSLSLRQWLEARLFSQPRKRAIQERISPLADGDRPLALPSRSSGLLPTDADRNA